MRGYCSLGRGLTSADSQEALERILDTTVENIRGFAEGRPTNLLLPRPPATAGSQVHAA